ncbi:hypothetical protein HMPREF3149_00235 [Corynebacterium sp. HMSC05E07]|nr:hypothetical protein HMPREF3149_00235 [Corynebacterium sp. HMSC05E07]
MARALATDKDGDINTLNLDMETIMNTPAARDTYSTEGPTRDIPQIWVGCMRHRTPLGAWFDCIDSGIVASITSDTVHDIFPASKFPEGCKNVLVMDTYNIPNSGEPFTLAQAVRWAEAYEEVGHEDWHPYYVWSSFSQCIVDAFGIPCVSDFQDVYQGFYENWREFMGEKLRYMDEDEIPRKDDGSIDFKALSLKLKETYYPREVVYEDELGVFVYQIY